MSAPGQNMTHGMLRSAALPCKSAVGRPHSLWARMVTPASGDSARSVSRRAARSVIALPDKLAMGWRIYALPEVGGGASPLPLMLWWALLLGLSSLTRYDPARWTAAIDVAASDLAISLERLFDVAEQRVPARILEGLMNQARPEQSLAQLVSFAGGG